MTTTEEPSIYGTCLRVYNWQTEPDDHDPGDYPNLDLSCTAGGAFLHASDPNGDEVVLPRDMLLRLASNVLDCYMAMDGPVEPFIRAAAHLVESAVEDLYDEGSEPWHRERLR